MAYLIEISDRLDIHVRSERVAVRTPAYLMYGAVGKHMHRRCMYCFIACIIKSNALKCLYVSLKLVNKGDFG